jgi:hypothetical protein
MRKLLIGLILLGLTTQVFAQIKTETLSEVEIKGVNYMYISKIDNKKEIARPVRELHQEVANLDVLGDDSYIELFGTYILKFNIPKGFILAEYNSKGVLLKTIERFRDVKMPINVAQAAIARYPGSEIVGDVYYISYHHKWGVKRRYKLRLRKEGKIKRVLIDEKGEFL